MTLISQEILENLRQAQQSTQADTNQAVTDQNPPVQEAATPTIDRGARYAGMFSDLDKKQAPEYSTKYEQQQKALMTAQTIGNALALVGDVAGAAKGAPVKRRQFKSTEPYLQAIENKRLQYEKDSKAFEKDKYFKQLQLMGLIDKEDDKTAAAEQTALVNTRADAASKRADESLGIQKETFGLRKEAQKEDIVAKKASTGLAREEFEERKSQFKQKMTAANVVEMVKNIQRDEKGNVLLYGDTDEGHVASLNESKVKRAFGLLLEDYGDSTELQEDLAMMKPAFGEGLSKGSIELLVQRHWDKSPKIIKFLGLGKPDPDFSGAKVTGAVGNTTTSGDQGEVDESSLPPFLRRNLTEPEAKQPEPESNVDQGNKQASSKVTLGKLINMG